MTQTTHPAKELVRDFMAQRRAAAVANPRQPLPTPEQIRRELGWDLIQRKR